MMTDPVADFFTRVRNGLMVHHGTVEMPSSKMKVRIAEILKEEGFIKNFRFREDGKQGVLKLYLKYHDGDPAIRGIRRITIMIFQIQFQNALLAIFSKAKIFYKTFFF
jgi:small subunit ribosomal protein S8